MRITCGDISFSDTVFTNLEKQTGLHCLCDSSAVSVKKNKKIIIIIVCTVNLARLNRWKGLWKDGYSLYSQSHCRDSFLNKRFRQMKV